ncbi:MAG: acetyl-CoA synthetase [Chaenotheca gracillima]|nr:MAG: acetyl-CoA synthetase [Chaenotheca gracillima]
MSFAGYKWAGIDTFNKGSFWHLRGQSMLESVDWEALCRYGTRLNHGRSCTLLPDIAMGGRHMVRILLFDDDTRWIARVRMPSRHANSPDSHLLKLEADALRYVKERTKIPVPTVFGHTAGEEIGAPVMLMECLRGNVGMDLNFDFIPDKQKATFYEEMAHIQTDISSLLLPKIGCIIRLEDGSYEVGPIPGFGGPFDTASDYLKAWGTKTQYEQSPARIRKACGDLGDEIIASTAEFPHKLRTLAERLCSGRDHGQFPFCHIDFGHNNIIVDDEYKVLGVIDWEHAFAAPWEAIDFPLTLLQVPAPMDAPWNYDEEGVPTDEAERKKLEDRKEYVAAVRRAEFRRELPSMLSDILNDAQKQNVATAMRLYVDGKMGLYSKVLDDLE